MSLQSYESGNIETAKYILDSDIILGNEVEFSNFLADLGNSTLNKLSSTHPNKIFACTLGENGATIASNGKITSIPATHVDKVVDSTGAGDAWAGGFIYGLSNNQTLKDSGEIAAKCAAKLLTVMGGRLPKS